MPSWYNDVHAPSPSITIPKPKRAPSLFDALADQARQSDPTILLQHIADPQTPASVWTQTQAGTTLLNMAIMEGSVAVVQALLQVVDPHHRSSFGDTPLMVAAMQVRPEMVDLLLPVSEPNAQNLAGQTAMMLVLDGVSHMGEDGDPKHHMAIVQALLPVSNLKLGDDHGMTALQIATINARVTLENDDDASRYWPFIDAIAAGSARAHARVAFKLAPSGTMPNFAALLQQEASAVVKAPRASSRKP